MEDWEDKWQRGDTPWDQGEAAPALLELLAGKRGKLFTKGPVLVAGCGSGHDVRALAAAGAEVVGMDIAPHALTIARSYPKGGDERYKLGNFLLGDESGYAGMWEYTCFCAIEPALRASWAESAARAVMPGGHLCGAFFLNPDHGGEGPPFGAERREIIELLAPWFELDEAWVPEHGFPKRLGREWLAIFIRKEVASPANHE